MFRNTQHCKLGVSVSFASSGEAYTLIYFSKCYSQNEFQI